jgi:ribonuclease BN (tRNA processing enzyme)
MALRVTVLGFAGAAPLGGACPSYAVGDGRDMLLLDCGPGTLERLWRFDLLAEIDAIVISHMHLDHVLDLPLLAGEVVRSVLGARRPRLFVPTGGTAVLRALDAAFGEQPRAETRFQETFELSEYRPEDRLGVGGLEVTFAPTAHRGLCCASRVSDGRSAVVYGADGSPCEELEQLAVAADLLMLEATYAEDAEAAAVQGHMTAVQAGELAARAGAKRLLLTHLLPGSDETLCAVARRAFDGPVELAREGLRYELG